MFFDLVAPGCEDGGGFCPPVAFKCCYGERETVLIASNVKSAISRSFCITPTLLFFLLKAPVADFCQRRSLTDVLNRKGIECTDPPREELHLRPRYSRFFNRLLSTSTSGLNGTDQRERVSSSKQTTNSRPQVLLILQIRLTSGLIGRSSLYPICVLMHRELTPTTSDAPSAFVPNKCQYPRWRMSKQPLVKQSGAVMSLEICAAKSCKNTILRSR